MRNGSYTHLPIGLQLMLLPEIENQFGLLAFLTCCWLNHSENRVIRWGFGALFALIVPMAVAGLLVWLGVMPG